LTKGITQEAAFAAALSIIGSSPSLAALNGNVSLASFVPEGFVGIGVPIVTPHQWGGAFRGLLILLFEHMKIGNVE
jgi:hypothetical protein